MNAFRKAVVALSLLGLAAFAFAATVPGLTVRDAAYRNGNLEITARLYLPPGTGPHPAVLFVHGRRGWGEQAESQVERIARQGYAVLAPDYHSPPGAPRRR